MIPKGLPKWCNNEQELVFNPTKVKRKHGKSNRSKTSEKNPSIYLRNMCAQVRPDMVQLASINAKIH